MSRLVASLSLAWVAPLCLHQRQRAWLTGRLIGRQVGSAHIHGPPPRRLQRRRRGAVGMCAARRVPEVPSLLSCWHGHEAQTMDDVAPDA